MMACFSRRSKAARRGPTPRPAPLSRRLCTTGLPRNPAPPVTSIDSGGQERAPAISASLHGLGLPCHHGRGIDVPLPQVGDEHDADEFLKARTRPPAKPLHGLGGGTAELADPGGTEVTGGDIDVAL